MGRGEVGSGGVVLLTGPPNELPPQILDDITVYVVVHPINTAAHPTVPEGFRWAVMLGPCGPGDMSRCANAGWCPDRKRATAEGDQNGATGTRALRVAGLNVRYGEAIQVLQLDYDPVAAGNDPVFVA
jgi:hypothetical protein